MLQWVADHSTMIIIICIIGTIILLILDDIASIILKELSRRQSDLLEIQKCSKEFDIYLSNLKNGHIDKEDFYHVLMKELRYTTENKLKTGYGKSEFVKSVISCCISGEEIIKETDPDFDGIKCITNLLNSNPNTYMITDSKTLEMFSSIYSQIENKRR